MRAIAASGNCSAAGAHLSTIRGTAKNQEIDSHPGMKECRDDEERCQNEAVREEGREGKYHKRR
jgi:hypothetical protein